MKGALTPGPVGPSVPGMDPEAHGTGHTIRLPEDAGPGEGPLGEWGEALAADHLAADGTEVLARNWRLAAGPLRGELDVIGLDHAAAEVVVCEVKARRDGSFGGPLRAVTPRKQQRVRRLAAAFLAEARLPYHRVRFDVIAIWRPRDRAGRLRHLRGAF